MGNNPEAVTMENLAMFDQNTIVSKPALTLHKREEIVRRYWMKGELTPLGVANALAGQRVPQAA